MGVNIGLLAMVAVAVHLREASLTAVAVAERWHQGMWGGLGLLAKKEREFSLLNLLFVAAASSSSSLFPMR